MALMCWSALRTKLRLSSGFAAGVATGVGGGSGAGAGDEAGGALAAGGAAGAVYEEGVWEGRGVALRLSAGLLAVLLPRLSRKITTATASAASTTRR
jgi:hypothetical protein